MGTRNLTMVVANGKTKIAQYGQWDGYPSGQGKTILNFLLSHSLDEFKTKLKKVRFATKKDDKEKDEFLKSIGSNDGWLTMEQSAKYDQKYRFDSRNHGGEILKLIFDAPEDKIVLVDSSSFAADSLFCEWAYVVDLDKGLFEVYKGFNKTPLSAADRFYYLTDKKDGEYYPVKLVASFSLSELPSEEDFIKQSEPQEVEEED